MALSKTKKQITFISTVLSAIVSILFLIDWIKSVPVFSTLKFVWNWLVEHIVWIATYNIQVWIIIVALAVVIALIKVSVSIKRNTLKTPPYIDYTEDIIDNIKWKWKYQFDQFDRRYVIAEQKAYCPKCDSLLRGKSIYSVQQTECIRCNFSIQEKNIYSDLSRINLIIIDNIERKQKSNSVNPIS